MELAACRDLARTLRADAIRATTAAGSGHPTSSLSAADLLAVLIARHLRLDLARPHDARNDHLVFSKGHASPLLYAVLKALGVVSDAELLTLRRLGSRLEGHPTPRVPLVDAATGSLGQGIGVGAGLAWSAMRREHTAARTWVLLGDSEMAEGSVWEAFGFASHARLSQLVAIIDVNRLGQRGETMLGWDLATYAARARAFGWNAIPCDGHDLVDIDQAFAQAERADAPICIIARTIKGKGVSFLEDAEGWHGKALPSADAERALQEIGAPQRPMAVVPLAPLPQEPVACPVHAPVSLPPYRVGTMVATREAYGDALRALGASDPRVLVLDAEVANSTYADRFAKAFPERFVECYIAEQVMISIAQGLAARGGVPFASTFAAFLSRAHDQVRMAAVSAAPLRLCGSHCGVSIGEDGPSQMGLEDLALFRALDGSTVLYPSDATSTARLVEAMASREGICYLRTTREKTRVLYGPDEQFPIGEGKVLRSSAHDLATIVAAGITVREGLAAAERLAGEGLHVRVVDCYSIKPIPAELLRACADQTGHLIIVEDHRPEGGLGEAVLSALAGDGGLLPRVTHLAVRTMPTSGTCEQLLERHGISARHIAEAVHQVLSFSG